MFVHVIANSNVEDELSNFIPIAPGMPGVPVGPGILGFLLADRKAKNRVSGRSERPEGDVRRLPALDKDCFPAGHLPQRKESFQRYI